jgi:hypothetical protein
MGENILIKVFTIPRVSLSMEVGKVTEVILPVLSIRNLNTGKYKLAASSCSPELYSLLSVKFEGIFSIE